MTAEHLPSAPPLRGGRDRVGPPVDGPAQELIDSGFELETADAPFLHAGLNLADLAHVVDLHERGVIPLPAARRLVGVLLRAVETPAEAFPYDPRHGEPYNSRERAFAAEIGDDAGWLHAGRPRREAVRIALRLHVRNVLEEVITAAAELAGHLADLASRTTDAWLPDQTYLQHAQPVSFGHQLLAHVHAFARDVDRLRDWDRRAAISPLGSGALAGSSLPLDPQAVARELGFDEAAANSMDAVADRDFAAEFLFCAAMIGVHLSRLGEEIVLWASQEFRWIEMDDAYSTGSSIMPQKKNPDVAELARGKSGRLIGNLMSLLTTLKGLPLTYNRDLQEDKEPVFDSVDTLLLVLPAMAGLVSTMRVNTARLEASAPDGFALATDLAELLVRRGVPFREAHEAVGHLVV